MLVKQNGLDDIQSDSECEGNQVAKYQHHVEYYGTGEAFWEFRCDRYVERIDFFIAEQAAFHAHTNRPKDRLLSKLWLELAMKWPRVWIGK